MSSGTLPASWDFKQLPQRLKFPPLRRSVCKAAEPLQPAAHVLSVLPKREENCAGCNYPHRVRGEGKERNRSSFATKS